MKIDFAKTSSRLPGFIYTFRLYADGTSCFPFASEGIQNIYRINATDAEIDSSKVFELIHPDDLEEVNNSILESAKNLTPWQHEYRVVFDDGSIHWLYGDAIPEPSKDEDGSQLWHGFITEITERKQLEAKVALSESLKFQDIENRRLEAEQSNKIKSQFLAMMSHEIRTPLNGLLGVLELLTHTSLDSVQTEYLKTSTLAGNNLLNIVNDILDLTKVETDKLELENIPFDIIELTLLSVKLLMATAESKGLTLLLIIDPMINTSISGDPHRFRQVLTNLISNAIKFTEKGSIMVKLSPQVSTDNCILIEVTDTGIGIPEELQSKLFEVFVQIDPSDTRKYGGSGLGLAISKKLVTLWKGDIGLESTPYGSRFWFTAGILVNENTPKVITKPVVNNLTNTYKVNILLVEDSSINQMVMATMLRNEGHHVDLADCGQGGIDSASKKDYDIILMDVSMPDMSGMEATIQIRQLDGVNAVVPIIAITAHAITGYEKLCIDSGMNGYATKPINRTDLINIISTWCVKIIDENILNELIRVIGEQETSDMIELFISELQSRCKTIKKAITKQDLQILSREGHTIKSSSFTFGAIPLFELSKSLEYCGYNDDLPEALLLAKQLLICEKSTIKSIVKFQH